MDFIKKLNLAALISLTVGQTAMAAELVPRDRQEAASAYCEVEWTNYVNHASNQTLDDWAGYPPLGIDPDIDTPTTDAFNKFALSALALAEYLGSYSQMTPTELQKPEQYARFKSQFDLATCLTPTEAEKDLIVAFGQSTMGLSETKIRTEFFAAINLHSCTGIEGNSKKIFQLDPQSASFSSDFQAIQATIVTSCE